MNENKLLRILVCIMMIVISGCTGMRMNPPPDIPGIKILPITASLVRDLAKDQTRPTMMPTLPADLRSDPVYQYLIGPRDVLSIVVWDHPELTIPAGQFRSAESSGHLVSEAGTIFYPHVGTVIVAGKTIGQVRDILTEKISRYIQNPQLDVRVASYRSQKAYLLGQVNTPGPLPITDVPLTVVQALGLAGGTTAEADLTGATLTRNDKTYPIDLLAILHDGEVGLDVLLKEGDILHIPDQDMRKVYVMGEILKQKSVLMTQNRRSMTLVEAISDAGGIDQITANPGRIYVVRGNPDSPEERTIFHLNADSPDALVLAEHFQLKPRDIVYVDTAGVTRWNRVISQIIPSQLIGLGRLSTR